MNRLFLTPGTPSSSSAWILPRSCQAWEIGPAPLAFAPATAADGLASSDTAADLRLTLGGEVPDIRALLAELPDGTPLGEIDVRYGCIFQPFALRLSPDQTRAITAQGLRLRAADPAKPVRVLHPVGSLAASAPGLAPHLLPLDSTAHAWSRFDDTLASLQSLQPFNWIEGCVMDGLRALGAESALAAHLDYFFPEGRLHYTGPRGELRRDEIFGIEALLPFAFLPAAHLGVSVMQAYVAAKTGPNGLILDRGEDAEGRPRAYTEITIEGCYTLSYPLAVASRRDGRPDWAALAWAQTEARCQHLVRDGVVAQRARLGAEPEQGDWARACGWFLIGVARSADTLGHCPPSVAAVFAAVARRALALQSEDGLWSVYLAEPTTGSDTSGSAAIVAGLALGARLGLVPDSPELREALRRALDGFVPHLTADGLLGGVAQLNRGGEALQRGGFRVLAPFAMGLLASARAAINQFSTHSTAR